MESFEDRFYDRAALSPILEGRLEKGIMGGFSLNNIRGLKEFLSPPDLCISYVFSDLNIA